MSNCMCQSCGMPMSKSEEFGTNADGSQNNEYCIYCYKDGAFEGGDCTMEEMIDICVPMVSKGNPYSDEVTAKQAMGQLFPTLKRWKKD